MNKSQPGDICSEVKSENSVKSGGSSGTGTALESQYSTPIQMFRVQSVSTHNCSTDGAEDPTDL